jgi:hypothetical protein
MRKLASFVRAPIKTATFQKAPIHWGFLFCAGPGGSSVLTAVIALHGIDTVASTFTSIPSGNYLLKDIPAGSYSLSFVPSDTSYKTSVRNSSVTAGNITVADTVFLQH